MIGAAVAFIIYINEPNLQWLSITIIGLGFVMGLVFAERVRRKYGCTKFMSRLISTPDLWPTDTYDKKNRNKSTSRNQDI
jgi:hypothetical protein